MKNIDRVPVTLVHDSGDYRCPVAFAEEIYNEITTPEKHFFVKNARHFAFAGLEDANWVNEIESII